MLFRSASIDAVTLAYLPKNTAPLVRSVTVSAAATGQAAAKPASSSGAATAAYSITVSDTGETAVAAGAAAQAVSRTSGQQLQISWQADDPDGDKLLYSLFFRADDETRWKLLRANMTENAFLLESDVLADGRYYFRVVEIGRAHV